MKTSLTWSGVTCDFSSAPLIAAEPSCGAVISASEPMNTPIGVRAPDRMTGIMIEYLRNLVQLTRIGGFSLPVTLLQNRRCNHYSKDRAELLCIHLLHLRHIDCAAKQLR